MDEFEIISKYIKPTQGPRLVQSVGDDCSVMETGSDLLMLQCTDCLVEDVHFRLTTFSFKELAYKALAVNISDIAAMGGFPEYAHLSLALPEKTKEENIEEFFGVFQDLCAQNNIALAGGDISRSEKSLFINVHLTGSVDKRHVMYRQAFAEPSVLCVTGPLGDSAAGLHCLENQNHEHKELISRHHFPPILWRSSQWLAQSGLVFGMMDLSDGLASDLKRLPEANYKIHLEKLPLSKELLKFCEQENKDPIEFAIAGGEDYQLLFNCRESDFESLKSQYYEKFKTEIFCIGEIGKGHGIEFFENGQKKERSFSGFSHFKN